MLLFSDVIFISVSVWYLIWNGERKKTSENNVILAHLYKPISSFGIKIHPL